MGRKSTTGAVRPKGERIEFTIFFRGKRYRPTIKMTPSQANLKHARRRREEITRLIDEGKFGYAEFNAEFPGFNLVDPNPPAPAAVVTRPTFTEMSTQFLASIGDLEHSTRAGYRHVLNTFWIPEYGHRYIDEIGYAELKAKIGGHPWGTRKTRNNVLSVGKRVFEFAFEDEKITRNPLGRVKSLKPQRPMPDPYTLTEAEQIIAQTRKDWGESDANRVEFCFFAGLRPSELIALQWPQVDLLLGVVRIDRARVMGRGKGTKTGVIRDVELNPRALAALKRQRSISGLAGKAVFTDTNGLGFHDLQVPIRRWSASHKSLTIRYRKAKNMRQTSVSWNLMLGKNVLWVARMHGHSVAVMLSVYAKWLEGATPEDIAALEAAFSYATNTPLGMPLSM